MKENKINKVNKVNIFYNPIVKIMVAILFIVSSVGTVHNMCNYFTVSDTRVYRYSSAEEYLETLIYNNLRRESNIEYLFHEIIDNGSDKNIDERYSYIASDFFENTNLMYTIYNDYGEVIADTYNQKSTPYKYKIDMSFDMSSNTYYNEWSRASFGSNTFYTQAKNTSMITSTTPTITETTGIENYDDELKIEMHKGTMMLYVDSDFAKRDFLSYLNENSKTIYYNQDDFITNTIGLFIISLLILMPLTIGIGRNSKKNIENINEVNHIFLSAIPFDILTFFFLFISIFISFLLVNNSTGIFYMEGTLMNYGANDIFFEYFIYQIILVLVCLAYYTVFVAHIKDKTLFDNTVIFKTIKKVWLFLAIPKVVNEILNNMGIYTKTILGLIIYSIYTLFSAMLGGAEAEILAFWIPQMIFVWGICLYIVYMLKELGRGSEALANGDFENRVDTEKLKFGFKDFGENLNKISNGVEVAVEERMKSERMKTELITNVSHDIKTPLTSIINYADLIGKEETDNEKIKEYIEVVLRQSNKLKRLMNDLVEASKASTGNLDIELEPCEIGVLLTQLVGEYEEKLAKSDLSLIINQVQEDVKILGDGRRMWRVFDNLMNNILNYSQENTRVYIDVYEDEQSNQVSISFKNMSKYPLNIKADELMERFVRGDGSRNTEGNGLGLSIARSLTELQNGKFELIIDGDLFKVLLIFDRI